jgi:hypothetical protein
VRLDMLGVEGRRQLVKDVSRLHSFNVCEIINSVDSVTDDTVTDRLRIMTLLQEMEQLKDKIMVKGKAKYATLLTEKEKSMDQKRECEFEFM